MLTTNTKQWHNASPDQSNSALANGIIDSKTKTILTTSGNTAFMSPLGPIQLTAEECNEILMKRAAAAVVANNQHTISTTDAQHAGECCSKSNFTGCFFLIYHKICIPAIAVQVQKVIQGLEDNDDSQATTSTHQLKIEPTLSISPKLEAVEIDYVCGLNLLSMMG